MVQVCSLYKEEILGFTHSFDNPCSYTKGYQCQSCGEFHTISFLGDKKVSSDKCSCGGRLSNGNPLFCPKCKARDVLYRLKYMR